MRKFGLVLMIVGILSCGGTLTEEQRKKMHEAAEQQAIVKISDAEIIDAAFAKGRSVLGDLSPKTADSLAKTQNIDIHWLAVGSKTNSAMEQQLLDAYLDAYINSAISGAPMRDNVQKIGQDSVLYTSVVVLTRPDSTIEVKGTWNIWMSKKQLILGMKKH